MLYGETPAVAGAMAFDVNSVRKIFFTNKHPTLRYNKYIKNHA